MPERLALEFTLNAGTYRHPKVVALLVGCRELDLSTGSRYNDTLSKQARRLNVCIVNDPHTRDEY